MSDKPDGCDGVLENCSGCPYFDEFSTDTFDEGKGCEITEWWRTCSLLEKTQLWNGDEYEDY